MRQRGNLLSYWFVIFLAACGCPPEKPQPVRPDEVLGWRQFEADGLHHIGDLVLNKGESSDNGKLGIAVLNITPPQPCVHEGWFAYPNATIRFYRPTDNQVICEHTWIPGSIVLGA